MPTIRSRRNSSDASTSLIEFGGGAPLAGYTAAVSLHAHTNRSREGMSVVPPYLDRIPLVGLLVRRELHAYQQRHDEPVDFGNAWWHPPLDPGEVLASEQEQITDRLGLRPIVSLTDHDNIEAPLALGSPTSACDVPLSVEWTVPFGGAFLHLGIHNLPWTCGEAIFSALLACTRERQERAVAELLRRLDATPETLMVFNHPLWDLAGIGAAEHASLVRRFLAEHGGCVHAIEVNGYRSWAENTGAIHLAGTAALPVVSGGDRHGCAPNALLNLTSAASFGEFAREVREQRRSVVLIMPEYRQSLVNRKLAVVSDALRAYPSYPAGRQRWTDRVAYQRDGRTQRLSEHWPDGGPPWVQCATRLFGFATQGPLKHGVRAIVWMAGASTSDRQQVDRIAARPQASPDCAPFQEMSG
jgi:hypothetical protein